jgi:hypothetical protein
MSVNYRASLKDTRMTAVVTDIGASGKLKLYTDADLLLVTLTLAATAGTVASGVLTLSGTPLSATAVAAGLATKATITKSDDTVIVDQLTVGTGTTQDVRLNSNDIASGQTVTITAASFTHG